MRIFFLLVGLLFLSLSNLAQDRITMMSGVVVPCQIVDDQGIQIQYRVAKKFDVRYFPNEEYAQNATWKTRQTHSTWCKTVDNPVERIFTRGKVEDQFAHRSDVFSFQKGDSDPVVLYAIDPVLGDWMSIEELEIYMAGEQDARSNYNTNFVKYIGVPLGLATAYMAQGGIILSIMGPLGYTIYQLLPNIRIKEQTITHPSHRFNETYALGYERVARSRRTVQALKSSALGMAAGILAYFIAPLPE